MLKDTAHARTLLQKGCDSADGDSCNSLAFTYVDAPARQVDLYRQACHADSMNGCRNLGISLTADPATWQEGHDAYQKACDGKLLDACVDVEKSYDNAPATVARPPDAERVARITDLCSDSHVPYACSTAARWYADDKRVAKDMRQVGIYAALACSKEEAAMCRNAALLIANGQLTAEPEPALFYFKQGCTFGDAVSCTHACELGDTVSCAPPK